MARRIMKKYYFGAFAGDVCGVHTQVSKKEYDRLIKALDHQMFCNDLLVCDDYKMSVRTEVRYDGDEYRETVRIYTSATTDFEFVIREAKPGYYFK